MINTNINNCKAYSIINYVNTRHNSLICSTSKNDFELLYEDISTLIDMGDFDIYIQYINNFRYISVYDFACIYIGAYDTLYEFLKDYAEEYNIKQEIKEEDSLNWWFCVLSRYVNYLFYNNKLHFFEKI